MFMHVYFNFKYFNVTLLINTVIRLNSNDKRKFNIFLEK